MYRFRQITEDRMLLGRPRSVERIGMAVLVTGLAVLGAPLTGEFHNVDALLIVATLLIAIGLRLCFFYSRVRITRSDRDIIIEGYWFRSAFRVKRDELVAIRNHRHNLSQQSYSGLEMVFKNKKVVVIYSSWLDELTSDDARLLATFLNITHERVSDWDRLSSIMSNAWGRLWGRKRRRKP